MNQERWRQIEAVFAEAVELSAERSRTYLDEVCASDEELRREVELLLESDRKAQGQIGTAVGVAAAAFAVQMQRDFSASQIGQRIGPYEIVREIGRGGMGSVYQAVRIDDQYIRSVAIKFIAQGMDTPEALARFRTERQILASLQHPNIAALLDGGATANGRPYIVMEYIEGELLLDYCQKRNLSVDDRLDLFCRLCDAVHHAHQSLVIHRDIKPGNVLVTENGVPKLLDFGIAKLLTPELVIGGAHTTQTVLRRMTPRYASPEQIRGESLTTATDIYSLGVLLYEMLTYNSPYRIMGQTSQEVERIVCDSEPIRLSAAVHSDSRVRRQISGDMENIVSMALRKEPQRRYASVQQFAADVQRCREGLPVSAREDTILYLATKLVRRNKLAAAAFALLALSVAGGWFATYRQAKRAEARFEEVRKLANEVLIDFNGKIQNLPGATPARELLVRTALRYLNDLSNDAASDKSLQWELGQAYEQVGDVQGDSSGPNLGQFREALISYTKALSLIGPLAGERRDYETLSCIAWLHFKCGDLQLRMTGAHTAIESYSRGLAVADQTAKLLRDPRADDLLMNGYMRLSNAKTRIAAANDALTSAQLAEAAAERAAKHHPRGGTLNLAKTRLLVGNLLWLQGDMQSAWNRYQEAVSTLEQLVNTEPDNTTFLENLAEAYRRSGDLQGNAAYFHFGNTDRANAYQRKALEIAQRLSARDPKDALARSHLSIALRRMGAVQRDREPEEAIKSYRESLEVLQSLMTDTPGDLNYQRDLANTHLGFSAALHKAGKLRQAIDEVTKALSVQREMLKRSPERLAVREDFFDSLLALGEIRLSMGEPVPALESLNQALSNAQYLVEREKQSLYSERCLAMSYRGIADYHSYLALRGPASDRSKHQAESLAWYDKSLGIWSSWRSRGVAVPFSANREREVLRARASVLSRTESKL
jgi:serine/threonine protein kinase/tetratricopeptide (TPR) repeat protein